jgi:signal transduction histidine kinase
MLASRPDFTSLAIFAFGALSFSTLAALYWGTHRPKRLGGSSVLPAFTLACAIAFVNSVALHFTLLSSLVGGLLPALILHLVIEMEWPRLPAQRAWRWFAIAFYAGAALPLLEGLNETGILQTPWSDAFYRAPAALLAIASAAGLVVLSMARRPSDALARAHRRWIALLLILMLVCAAVSWNGFGELLGSFPDYLLLLFFCITLYYRERLVFFDVLVKRGVFLAAGLGVVILLFPAARSPLTFAAGFLLCWLTAPWVYARMARAVDRLWLRRAWSPAEAERRFLAQIQIAAGEDELRLHAANSLSAIFHAPAEVRFDAAAHYDAGSDSLVAELRRDASHLGSIRLKPRTNGIPYLSDDRRLLESLARSLAVFLENIRFRDERGHQLERERELRLLASRAELKALRAQINPHFLFNALSVIGGLLHYRPQLADETIEQLAQVFRYTLGKSGSEWVPLGEEIEFVTAYLRIEQARFGERLHLEFDVDPDAARCPIPAMSIQPLVENAIKHGISAVAGIGTVELRVTATADSLQVEVLDSGPGFPDGFSLTAPDNGHGLRNIAERLRGYYGDRACLSWKNGPYTRVAITMPKSAGPLAGGLS